MCTALSYKSGSHYFGRNLDVGGRYGESVIITPGQYPLQLKYESPLKNHYAIIGIGKVVDDYPLYYDGTNEKGLSIAGLNFPENAYYYPKKDGSKNIAPYELIPYLLSRCENVKEAEQELLQMNIVNCRFRNDIPVTPLHWLIADKNYSIVYECTKEGSRMYRNPFEILTNNPPFSFHRENMNRYMGLHEGMEKNRLSTNLELKNTSIGFGAQGLPGDFSSVSRFVKCVYVKEKSPKGGTEQENISQFFHILSSVAMPKGCILMENGQYEYTRYTSCCNTHTGEFYYRTYDDQRIRKVSLHDSKLQGETLIQYPLDASNSL